MVGSGDGGLGFSGGSREGIALRVESLLDLLATTTDFYVFATAIQELANVCTLNICDSALLLHRITYSCFSKSCFTQVILLSLPVTQLLLALQVCGGEAIQRLPDLVQMRCT
ncbi:hypothetical protein L1987_18225 [Smallanthus sonchifolius]|uniref:Uncharacterized protein n=1 Tax=Smallanthus sonchifolius TaxID=185202 RepID=A0ACB9J1R6_9ASTR|nr:hypothetical protein L1987_18225 [Smallanthus sonchifolius]